MARGRDGVGVIEPEKLLAWGADAFLVAGRSWLTEEAIWRFARDGDRWSVRRIAGGGSDVVNVEREGLKASLELDEINFLSAASGNRFLLGGVKTTHSVYGTSRQMRVVEGRIVEGKVVLRPWALPTPFEVFNKEIVGLVQDHDGSYLLATNGLAASKKGEEGRIHRLPSTFDGITPGRWWVAEEVLSGGEVVGDAGLRDRRESGQVNPIESMVAAPNGGIFVSSSSGGRIRYIGMTPGDEKLTALVAKAVAAHFSVESEMGE